MIKLDKDSLIRLNASTYLTDLDCEVLNLLYAPLIKEHSLRLYFTMFSMLQRSNLEQVLKLDLLLDMIGFDLKEFNNSKKILEAIGLMTSYQNENENLFLLKTPLSPKQFLSDGILGMYLYSEVGEKTFLYLQKLFQLPKIDKNKYTEVTASFDDVFKSQDMKPIKNDGYILDKKINQGVSIEDHTFNFENFLSRISESFLEGRKATKKFETTIKNTAYAYSFNEEQMAIIYNKSLNSSGYFDYGLCSKNARILYQELYGVKTPKLELKSENKLEASFEMMTAKSLIKQFTNNDNPDIVDLENINNFYQNYSDIKRSILNCCVVYSIKKCEDKVPAYTYFKKVMEEWISKSITSSFDEVYEYITTKSITKSKTKKVDEPSWLTDYKRNIEEGVEDL